jgi:Ca2+-transporting ATPase
LTDYYRSSATDVLRVLGSSERGLSSVEAASRLRKFGLNELKEVGRLSLLWLFLLQFSSPLVWVLLFAVVLSFFLCELL